MDLILIAIGIVLLLFLTKNFYEDHWGRGLSVEIQLSDTAVYPGDMVTLTEIITNGKWLPLPMLKVKFAIDRSLEFSNIDKDIKVSDKCYKSECFSILFYQKIQRKLPFRCTKRGYYTIDSIYVVSSSLFMDGVLAAIIPTFQSITVYPEPLDSQELDISYNHIMGTLLSKRYEYEDPFEFRGIREYQTYDSMKLINWNASARTGQLKVNVHDYTASQEVCILLNLEEEGILKYDILKEKSISMACSLAYRLTAQGIGVSIISNGVDQVTGESIYIEGGSDGGHRNTINTSLARIDLKKDMIEFATLLADKRRQIEKASMIIMISTCKKRKLQEEYHKLISDSVDGLWIFPVHHGMDRKFDMMDPSKIIHWEV